MDWVRLFILNGSKPQKNKILTALIILILFATVFSQTGQGKFNVGIKTGFQYLDFDKNIESYGPNFGVISHFKINRYLRFVINADYINYTINKNDNYLIPLNVELDIDNKQTDEYRLYSLIGAGSVFYNNSGSGYSPQIKLGYGIEYFLGNKAGMFLDLSFNHVLSDKVEGIELGDNDNFLHVSTGFNFYFNSKKHRYINERVSNRDYLFDESIFEEIQKHEEDKFKKIKNILNGELIKDDSIKIIHKEIFEAEQGKDLYIYCRIKGDFFLPAFVFRWNKLKEWHIIKMKKLGADSLDIYGTKVNGRFVKSPKMEYFIMAVGNDFLTAGLFANKNNPVIVNVSKNKKFWFKIGKIFSIINILATGYFTIF